MRRLINSLVENFLIFVFAFLVCTNLQANEKNNTVTVSQSPPFAVTFPDSAIAPALLSLDANIAKNNTCAISTIVEDTVMPPCDIIFYKSGKLEYCKIIETTPTTISYKMCDYVDGPTIVVNKTTVHKIHYANGRDEIITADQTNMNAYVRARKDPLSTWALICSLIGIILFPAAIVGVILGIRSLIRIKRSNGALRGKGSAKAAIIIGGIILILTLLTI